MVIRRGKEAMPPRLSAAYLKQSASWGTILGWRCSSLCHQEAAALSGNGVPNGVE
jgi:hypothetical protein